MHNTGVFKKERKKDFIIEASVKRLNWTSWTFKYCNDHKYQKHIKFLFRFHIFRDISTRI